MLSSGVKKDYDNVKHFTKLRKFEMENLLAELKEYEWVGWFSICAIIFITFVWAAYHCGVEQGKIEKEDE